MEIVDGVKGSLNFVIDAGCGYRNIQMLCSYLITHPAYKLVLFGGVGHVPTIPVIQVQISVKIHRNLGMD